MTKPYQTTTTQPERPTVYRAPEDFTAKRLRATLIGSVALALAVIAVALAVRGQPMLAVVPLVLALFLGLNAWLLWEYSSRLINRELPKHPKAKRTGDTWRIHLRREIPVGGRGAVDMEPDPVDLPVAPSQFVNYVRQMQRTGTSRDKRPAGLSQPLWRKIMATLEDLDGATKGASGYEFTEDLDALLEDISRW